MGLDGRPEWGPRADTVAVDLVYKQPRKDSSQDGRSSDLYCAWL
jgi:hypothetical protein